tara:strand:+ start:1390 stop:1521 length:132 start_codon:yes stop_codon:yes gene_type:complete
MKLALMYTIGMAGAIIAIHGNMELGMIIGGVGFTFFFMELRDV